MKSLWGREIKMLFEWSEWRCAEETAIIKLNSYSNFAFKAVIKIMESSEALLTNETSFSSAPWDEEPRSKWAKVNF